MSGRPYLRSAAAVAAALALGTGCTVSASTGTPSPRFHPDPARPTAAFSPAVEAGGLLFLAGKLGTDSTGRLVPGGIGPETRQAMRNIGAELARRGSGFDRVAKCTVFLRDMEEWAAMNAEYTPFFPGPKPARSAVAVSGLALDARVEIECVAAA